MTRRSFYVRLLVGNLLLVFVAIGLVGVVARGLLEDEYSQRQRNYQQRATALAAVAAQPVFRESPKPVSQSVADRFCKLHLSRALGDLGPESSNLRITLIAMDGTVLGDTNPKPAADMEPHNTPDRPEVMAALRGRAGWDERRSETYGIRFQYYARPLVLADKQVAVIRTAMPIEHLTTAEGFIWRSLLWAAAVALGVVVALGIWLNWTWYTPLRQVADAAASIARGELHKKVRVQGAAELRDLADALNHMRESLARQLETITEQRANLQTVIRSLQDGIIATDLQDDIVLMNEAASAMFGMDPESAIGQNVQNAVRSAPLLEAYRGTQETGRPQRCEIRRGGEGVEQTLTVLVRPVEDRNEKIGFLIVLHDISEIAETMRVRNQFVENASHELRTPLAAVRAGVDSLEFAETPPEHRKIREILDRQVSQLEAFVRDLLDFSAVQHDSRPLTLEDVSLSEWVAWANHRFGDRAGQQGIALAAGLDGEDVTIRTDRRLLEIILQNLLDNALRFTPEGGQVTFETARTDDGVRLTVRDTGCGIAPADQKRVFERFYQVNPARSGQVSQRGTGLGLAIVKHAALRLGASVKLVSAVGEGTTVEVRLPSTAPASRSE